VRNEVSVGVLAPSSYSRIVYIVLDSFVQEKGSGCVDSLCRWYDGYGRYTRHEMITDHRCVLRSQCL
jgi:hypothetical protein